jgi:hypothetical protein
MYFFKAYSKYVKVINSFKKIREALIKIAYIMYLNIIF